MGEQVITDFPMKYVDPCHSEKGNLKSFLKTFLNNLLKRVDPMSFKPLEDFLMYKEEKEFSKKYEKCVTLRNAGAFQNKNIMKDAVLQKTYQNYKSSPSSNNQKS